MNEKPLLRQLDIFPLQDQGRNFIALRDPLGIQKDLAVVAEEFFFIASLFDGTHTLAEIQALLHKMLGAQVDMHLLETIQRNLDQYLLLDNDNFQRALHLEIEKFASNSLREPFHGGTTYPNDPAAAGQQIRDMLQHGSPHAQPIPWKALLSPHIDFQRGAITYGKTYSLLKNLTPPDLFVVLGTSHTPMHNLLCLTKKNYLTPFGPAQTDHGLVEFMQQHLPASVSTDEFCHRSEHSVEFQIHFLKFLFPQVPVVPILCGSIPPTNSNAHEATAQREQIEQAVAVLRKALQYKSNVFLLMGVDLAHVGPRFGEPPLTEAYLKQIAQEDQHSLDCIARGDSQGFYHSIVKDKNARKVCGFSPIYLGMRALAGLRGQLIEYRQCTSEDQSVTIAGMGFY